MSAYRSHLPEELPLNSVTGLGMNKEELSKNTELTSHVVHNLNQNPEMPFDDKQFDACTLSFFPILDPTGLCSERFGPPTQARWRPVTSHSPTAYFPPRRYSVGKLQRISKRPNSSLSASTSAASMKLPQPNRSSRPAGGAIRSMWSAPGVNPSFWPIIRRYTISVEARLCHTAEQY